MGRDSVCCGVPHSPSPSALGGDNRLVLSGQESLTWLCRGSGKAREGDFLLYFLSGHGHAIHSVPRQNLGVILNLLCSFTTRMESITNLSRVRPLLHCQSLL